MQLVKDLSGCKVPVIAEGRYNTPDLVKAAYEHGAHAVVVGKSITNPEFITRYFLNILNGSE